MILVEIEQLFGRVSGGSPEIRVAFSTEGDIGEIKACMWILGRWIIWRNRNATYPKMALQGELFLSGDCDTRGSFFHDQQVSAMLRVASGSFEEDPVCTL